MEQIPRGLSFQDELLTFWHTYRIQLVLVLGIVSFVIPYALRKQNQEPTLSSHTSHGLPTLEKIKQDDVSLENYLDKNKKDERVQNSSKIVSGPVALKSQLRPGPRRIKGSKGEKKSTTPQTTHSTLQEPMVIQPIIFFSSLTRTTETYAKRLLSDLKTEKNDNSATTILKPQLHDLSYIDHDDYFVSLPKNSVSADKIQYFYLILIPTYNVDTVLNTFLSNLEETHHDFRIDTAPLSNLLGYSVFGLGDREGWPTENEGFCSQAREVDKWMARLSDRKRAFPLGTGDVKFDARERFEEWKTGIEDVLHTISLSGGSLGDGVAGSGDAVESEEEGVDDEDDVSSSRASVTKNTKTPRRARRTSNVGDLEDLGVKVPAEALEPDTRDSASLLPIDFTSSSSETPSVSLPEPKPMVPVSSPTHTALTKQGYSIIGSHSGVKICRWTKSALRGRGSCYKRSFYGIASHLCMETTPSLSCSNKCVFCWRHGTNPVGTIWRWQVDPPELIFAGAKEAHLKKIKAMRGVPGIRAERFQEAMRIRHCALSLVGEPIFYPYINELVGMLHAEHISSFLVCNAQHPDQLAALKTVTQLYVSIDASNRDSLRKIDRPLHRDFWERFLRCLDILRERRFRMRTVFRLTLVKGFNIDDEVEGYADLVARGLPCFVEIKGVTYCGTSTSSSAGLTMQNVPFYSEVSSFVVALNDALAKHGLEYGIAAEHAHSCCVLLASTRFRKRGKWHTLIDYGRYFELLESGKEFTPEDYTGEETPEWALWGRGGFDPSDQRVDRKGRAIETEK